MSSNIPLVDKEALKKKIEALRDDPPSFLGQKSGILWVDNWVDNLNKLLAYVDKQPGRLNEINDSVQKFNILYSSVKIFFSLRETSPSDLKVKKALTTIKKNQSQLDDSLMSVPLRVTRWIATAAMALLSAALGAVVGGGIGAVYGFFSPAAVVGGGGAAAGIVGTVGAVTAGLIAGAGGGYFTWCSFSNKFRSTGEVDLSTMIPEISTMIPKKD